MLQRLHGKQVHVKRIEYSVCPPNPTRVVARLHLEYLQLMAWTQEVEVFFEMVELISYSFFLK
jgi:hypothetical protein